MDGLGGGGAGVRHFFSINPNLKYFFFFFLWGRGNRKGARGGGGGARVSDCFYKESKSENE